MFSILSEITAQISVLMNNNTAQIVKFAWVMFNSIAVFQLVMTMINWQVESMALPHWIRLPVPDLVNFLLRLGVASIMLTFYTVPLPGFGLGFHQLFPALGQSLANSINQSGDAMITANLSQAFARLPTPALLAPIETVTYLLLLGIIAVFQMLMFVVTAFGFIATAVLSMTGVLVIPLVLTKHFAKYFWNWIDQMFTYSMYPFISAVFIFVLGNSLNLFFMRMFAGSYSFAALLVALPVLLALLGTFAFCIFRIPAFAAQQFGGMGAVTSNIAAGAEAYIQKAIGG